MKTLTDFYAIVLPGNKEGRGYYIAREFSEIAAKHKLAKHGITNIAEIVEDFNLVHQFDKRILGMVQ